MLKSFLLVALAATVVFGAREDIHFGTQRIIDFVNSLNTSWTAGENSLWNHMTHTQIRGMLGVRPRPAGDRHTVTYSRSRMIDVEIPDTFDSRTQWPNCNSIKEVRDQSACGSCWAFGAVEAMSDRICIASGSQLQVRLSADDLLSCCSACGYGCNGGEPLAAWEYWVNTGIVTGGNYTTKDGCRPYEFPPCEHHSNRTHFKPCNKDLYPTPKCVHKCQNGYEKAYNSDKYYGARAYMVENNVEAIQKEILTRGPVEAAFEVYEDFLTYQSGVYYHVAGQMDGGHAVKMIGWGVEKGTPYWLLVNSWNNDWGDDGLFKIRRGNDECGIESQIVAGIPKLNTTKKNKNKKYRAEQ